MNEIKPTVRKKLLSAGLGDEVQLVTIILDTKNVYDVKITSITLRVLLDVQLISHIAMFSVILYVKLTLYSAQIYKIFCLCSKDVF